MLQTFRNHRIQSSVKLLKSLNYPVINKKQKWRDVLAMEAGKRLNQSTDSRPKPHLR